jgi:tripartite-type tricarboxylate transporter receptor subunit TctC
MPMRIRRNLPTLLAGLAIFGTAEHARSQEWPQRPVTIIVPFAAGGNTDGIARITAQRLGETFGQQFIVENRGGAGGAIAAADAARARPDGYTLFMAALPVIAIVPAMTQTRYDAVTDFAAISAIATNPFVLVVHQSMPVRTLGEFIAYVGARPGALSYASAGPGSLNHLSMALFLKLAGLEMIHVAYKGNAPALADVIAGHVPAMFSNLSDALPHVAGGAIRSIAVSSDTRAAILPDVPTVGESGFPQFKTLTWNGLMAPARTPRTIIDRIAREIARAVHDQNFAARLANYGADPLGNTPEEFSAMIAADIALWAQAVAVAGVKQP